MRHIPVLRQEVLAALQLTPNATVVDGTLGDAGHAEIILAATAPRGRLIGIDADPEAILRSKHYLAEYGSRVAFVRESFRNIEAVINDVLNEKVDAVLLDLGWSTPQFHERGRGFSFEGDEPLDMRFDAGLSGTETAADILATRSPQELAVLFSRYADEKNAMNIARAIVGERHKNPIATTQDLVRVIMRVTRGPRGKIHPATRVFQALRIAVNDEFGALQEGLLGAINVLAPGGRLAVITFHSGEDRIVKRCFSIHPDVNVITKKPLEPTRDEVLENPRARSAKVRVVEKKRV